MKKKRAAVVGATGVAGQQFVAALDGHPWFEITHLGASARSAGKRYGDALRDATSGQLRWWVEGEPPAALLDLEISTGEDLDTDADEARDLALEPEIFENRADDAGQ